MVIGNRGQGADGRSRDGVGGVQPPPHARFQYGGVAALLHKIMKGHGGVKLKFRHPLALGLKLAKQGNQKIRLRRQIFFGNPMAVQLNPFPEVLHIGGDKQPCLQPGVPQDRRRHRRRASLAVGARDMDQLQLILGVPQQAQQRLHSVHPVPLADIGNGVDKIHRLLIGRHIESFPLF